MLGRPGGGGGDGGPDWGRRPQDGEEGMEEKEDREGKWMRPGGSEEVEGRPGSGDVAWWCGVGRVEAGHGGGWAWHRG